jgi:elongation factor G
VGGSIPKQFMPAIEKGVRQALTDGAIAGYPMTGVRVEVTDGKHHPVDSKEIAFITAGKKAFIDAVGKASPRCSSRSSPSRSPRRRSTWAT